MMILSTRMRLLLLPLFVFAIQIQSELQDFNLKGQSMRSADHSLIQYVSVSLVLVFSNIRHTSEFVAGDSTITDVLVISN
jgi:protein-S-isoprenylcysteine O-methyltransferase Ste14